MRAYSMKNIFALHTKYKDKLKSWSLANAAVQKY